MAEKGKRALLTGATGFIGSHVLAELLSRGYEVHAIVHNARATEQPGLVQHQLDLMDAAAVEAFFAQDEGGFDTLLHLAWYVGPRNHVHESNMDWVAASLHLLQSFARHGGRVFMGVGTSLEYDYKYGYLTEDQTPTSSASLYGKGKNAVCELAGIYCAQRGITFKWPRLFNGYGPRETECRLVAGTILSCLRGEDVRVSECTKFQDFQHVEDTARGIVAVLESELQGVVNICSGRPVQLREIVSSIARLTQFKGNILWGALPSAYGGELVVGNNEKLKSIGWTPKYTLESGLQHTIDWWRQHAK